MIYSQLPQHTTNCKQATNASRNSLLVSLRENLKTQKNTEGTLRLFPEFPRRTPLDGPAGCNHLIPSTLILALLNLVLLPLRHLPPCGVLRDPHRVPNFPSFLGKRLTAVNALSPLSPTLNSPPLRKRREYMNGARNRVSLCSLVYLVPARWGSGNCCCFLVWRRSLGHSFSDTWVCAGRAGFAAGGLLLLFD